MVLQIDQFLSQQYPDNSIIANGLLVRQGRLIVGGDKGSGKTTLITQLGLELAAGEPFVANYETVAPQKVLLIQEEIGPRSYQDRLRKSITRFPLLNPQNFHLLTTLSLRVDEILGQKEIEEALGQVQPNVLILDPLYKLHSADENSEKEMKQITDYFDYLLVRYNIAIAITHHLRKLQYWQGKPVPPSIADFRGANVIAGWADSRLLLFKGPDYHTLSFDLRNAAEEEHSVTMDFDRNVCLFEIIQPPNKQHIDAVMGALLTQKYIPYQDLLDDLSQKFGVTDRTIRKSVAWLKGRGDINIVGDGRYPRQITKVLEDWELVY